MARLPFLTRVCSQYVGKSQYTCGLKVQRSVDSRGTQTHNLHNTCVLEGRHSNQLSHNQIIIVFDIHVHVLECVYALVNCFFPKWRQ